MFDIGYSELLLIGIVALVVIGPKDLPRVMRTVGQWMGKGRAMARHFRSGVDAMIRESEIEEMNKQWAAHNAAIMAAAPSLTDLPAPAHVPDDPERSADADELPDLPQGPAAERADIQPDRPPAP